MADLRHRFISLFLALAILLAFVVVPGCKKKEEPAKAPDSKQVEKQATEKQKEAEKALEDVK